MMKNTNESETHFFDAVDYPREAVPNTQFLQAAILESAKQTPQHKASDARHSASSAFLRKIFFWPPSLLQSAVMLSFMLIFSGGLLFIGDDGQYQGFDSEQKITIEAFSENDLDWQELLLIEDELLFAQL